MRYSIDNPGQYGIVRDIAPYELPDNAWSNGENVRFEDRYAFRAEGESSLLTADISSDDNLVYYLTPVRTDTSYFWIYAGRQEAWATDLSSESKIYTATNARQYWSSGFLQGILLATNGADSPQSWVPSLSNTFEPLSYDNSASTTWAGVEATCRTIRTFKNYGVALDTTETGNRNSRRVWWSHPATAGNEPYTWDYTKPAYDAGQYELDDDPEPVIDCYPMRGDNLIYKYNSVHRMSEIGAPYIFGFDRIFNTIGARSRNSVKEFFGQHVVFGFEDMIVHNGQEHQSIFKSNLRRWIINNIDDSKSQLCMVAPDYINEEMYFAFPEVGETYLTTAAVWNWRENTTSIRELKDKLFIAAGIVSPSSSGTTFAQDIGSFQSAVGIFDQQLYNDVQKSILCVNSVGAIASFPSDNDKFIGADYTSFLERQGLPMPGVTGSPDIKELKYIYRLYPRIEGDVTVTIKLAEQFDINGAIKWHTFSFDPTTDYKIDCRVTTRIPGIWIGSMTGSRWKLSGIDIEYDHAGYR